MIRYYNLFDLLFRKNMKLTDLRKILSSATIAKLNKGEYISGEALDKLCEFLECQPDDIMEHYTVRNKDKNTQSLMAVKTLKEVNKYGEEIPVKVFIKHITEPLNADNKPIQGWYDREIKEIFEGQDEWDKCQIYAENALLNKNIKDMIKRATEDTKEIIDNDEITV